MQAGQFVQGLGAVSQRAAAAASSVQSSASAVGAAASRIGGFISSTFSTLAGQNASGLVQSAFAPIAAGYQWIAGLISAGSLGGAVGLLAAGAAAAIGGVIATGQSAMKAASDHMVLAATIGQTAEATQRFAYVLTSGGIDVEEHARLATIYSQRIGRIRQDLVNGSGQSSAALQQLGIDARQFVSLPIDRQMIALSQGFRSIDAQSAGLAMRTLFGRQGQALTPLLARGPEAIQGMIDRAPVLSNEDTAVVRQAVSAQGRAKAVVATLWTGFSQQMAAGIAPAVIATANMVERVAALGRGPFQQITAVVRTLVGALGQVWIWVVQIAEAVMPIYGGIVNVVSATAEWLGAGLQMALHIIGEIMSAFGGGNLVRSWMSLTASGLNSLADTIRANIPSMVRFLADVARTALLAAASIAEMLDASSYNPAMKAADWMIDALGLDKAPNTSIARNLRNAANAINPDALAARAAAAVPQGGGPVASLEEIQKAQKLADDYRRQADQLQGVLELENRIGELRRSGTTDAHIAQLQRQAKLERDIAEFAKHGVDPEIIRRIRSNFEIVDAMQMQLDLAKEINKLNEQTQDPAEKFRAEMERLTKLQAAGADPNRIGRARLAALRNLEQAAGTGTFSLPPQLLAGSVAAVSHLNRAKLEEGMRQDDDPQARMVAALEALAAGQPQLIEQGARLNELFAGVEGLN
jgi:hypothetical protein